jgi:hypothetical protein
MTNYFERYRTAPLVELEATATSAVREAIAASHAAGLSTVGLDASGRLIRTFPDGREVPVAAVKESEKKVKPVPSRRFDVNPSSRRMLGLLGRRTGRAAAATVNQVQAKATELQRAINGALSLEPAKPAPVRKRQKGLDR